MRTLRSLPLVLLAVLSALLIASCGPLPIRSSGSGGGGGGGGEAAMTAQCRGDFGASAAAAEFEAFMTATYAFHEAASDTQRVLLESCQAMGRELGMPAAELQGTGVEGTRAVCTAVSNTLRTEWDAINAGTEYQVQVQSTPPRCEASFDAYAECAGRCDVSVTPGELEMRCTGGEIRGSCSAQCTGHCAVSVEARCAGTCEGVCEGTCSARAADGSCAGSCDGTCRGSCVTDASASCSGECRGSCSVEWQRPYCTGHYDPPQVNADCRAACEAQIDARLSCQPGRTEVTVTGGPTPEMQARIARVRAAVGVGLSQIAVVRARVQRLQESGRALSQHLRGLPDSVRNVGLSAALCSTAAVSDIARSMASVSMSFEVSVSVSASVSASAG